MIYLFSDYNKITDDILIELTSKLPEKRKKRALKYKNKGGQISCTIGYLLFLYGFRYIYQEKSLPEFATDRNGKPFLSEFPDVFFNISHCNGAAACIFGDMPVGIDIQDMREINTRAVMKVCSEEEIQKIKDSAEPALEFCRIWSIKESLSKLSGQGVFRDIRNLCAHGTNTHTYFFEPDKYMTASTLGKDDIFTIHKLTLNNLLSL